MKKIISLKQLTGVAAMGLLLASTTASALGVSIDANVNTTVKASSSASGYVNSGASTTVDMTGRDNTSTNSNITTGLKASIVSPMNISADADLKVYEDTLMKNESSVSKIDTDTDSAVTVSWKHPGKLFAFIPVKIESKTTVEATSDNTVKIKTRMPWWRIFVSGVSNTSADIESSLQSSEEIKAHMRASANADAKARVVHAIISELALKAQAEANAQSSVEVK